MRYISRHRDVVYAYKYTIPMNSEVMNLLSIKTNLYYWRRDNKLMLKHPGGDIEVKVGDMLILLPNGLLSVMDPQLFHLKYKKSKSKENRNKEED